MKKTVKTILGLMLGILLATGIASAQEDKKGCKDHPLFSRMEGYYLYTCESKEFDAFDFIDPATKQKVTVEGRKLYTGYSTKKGFKGKYSYIQVSRNYTNAIEKIGGTFWVIDPKKPYRTSMKLVKDDKEIWAWIHIDTDAENIHLTVVEKQAMTQEIVANAKFMAEGLSSTGHVAIYGIYFDFNKADVKPESEPALKEITKLLQQDAKLKLYVVGHTDNVGGLDYNMKLSQQRAEAVVKELVSKYKIAPDRLKAGGVGPLAPVTSNDTEEGKAKNRRVELVKQ
ncbi:MAG: OmpA family protein [Syntrophaceae bacterium]|nr:OmpA family protein [Syntrophaceae bacterium]